MIYENKANCSTTSRQAGRQAGRQARNYSIKLLSSGFTLVELSIVLVVIGLIIGGILFGRDLIKASEIRSQITQIENFQAAVNVFKLKYGYLPGDIKASTVSEALFTIVPTRTDTPGRGNGDGAINAYNYAADSVLGWGFGGENIFFWADLSANSGLINGNFSTVSDAGINLNSNAAFAPYLPRAKIGGSNYVSIFTVRYVNYFQIISPFLALNTSRLNADAAISVQQAYNIDQKIDDGIPVTGRVLATMSISANSAGTTNLGLPGVQGSFFPASTFSSAIASTTTCYDTTTNTYSTMINNGESNTCAVSFKFQ